MKKSELKELIREMVITEASLNEENSYREWRKALSTYNLNDLINFVVDNVYDPKLVGNFESKMHDLFDQLNALDSYFKKNPALVKQEAIKEKINSIIREELEKKLDKSKEK